MNKIIKATLSFFLICAIGLRAVSGIETALKHRSIGEIQPALEILFELDQENAHVLKEIGTTYCISGDLITGIKYYKKALEIAEELNDSSMLAKLNGNIGNAFAQSGNFEIAKIYYLKRLNLSSENKINILNNIAGNYLTAELPDSALKYLREIEDLSTSDTGSLFSLNINKGLANLQLKNPEAIISLEKAEQYVRSEHDQRLVLKNLLSFYDQHNMTSKAYGIYRQFAALDKKLMGDELKQEIKQLHFDHENKILDLQQKHDALVDNIKKGISGTLMAFLLMGGMSVMLFMRKNSKEFIPELSPWEQGFLESLSVDQANLKRKLENSQSLPESVIQLNKLSVVNEFINDVTYVNLLVDKWESRQQDLILQIETSDSYFRAIILYVKLVMIKKQLKNTLK